MAMTALVEDLPTRIGGNTPGRLAANARHGRYPVRIS